LLSEDEKKWLNDYHKTVYEKTAPYLTPEEAQWLAEKTKPVL
jgi:Xaa-Pro aminopeptidase